MRGDGEQRGDGKTGGGASVADEVCVVCVCVWCTWNQHSLVEKKRGRGAAKMGCKVGGRGSVVGAEPSRAPLLLFASHVKIPAAAETLHGRESALTLPSSRCDCRSYDAMNSADGLMLPLPPPLRGAPAVPSKGSAEAAPSSFAIGMLGSWELVMPKSEN